MKKMMICLTCLVALMAVIVAPSFAQGGQNVTMNANATMNVANITNNVTTPELHVGYQNVTPVNNLDVYGTKPVYNIEKYSQNTLLLNTSNAYPVQPTFNVSQREGVRPTIVYTTGQTKPMYNTSISPTTPVYNIEAYSPIKMGTPIP
ncbi:MAG: hypothetical protein WB392_06610 [Methanotrichaceae archaeon]